ncbi:hypothetical protein RFI_38642, partial [Reticulomyxa filosa]
SCLRQDIAMQIESLGGSSNDSSRYKQERNNHNLALLQRYLWKRLNISKERQDDWQKEKKSMTNNKKKGIYHYIFGMEKVQRIYHEKVQMTKVYKDWGDKETIFVALCSYRDDQQPPLSKSNISIVAICKTKEFSKNYMFKHDRGHYIDNPETCLDPFFLLVFLIRILLPDGLALVFFIFLFVLILLCFHDYQFFFCSLEINLEYNFHNSGKQKIGHLSK